TQPRTGSPRWGYVFKTARPPGPDSPALATLEFTPDGRRPSGPVRPFGAGNRTIRYRTTRQRESLDLRIPNNKPHGLTRGASPVPWVPPRGRLAVTCRTTRGLP